MRLPYRKTDGIRLASRLLAAAALVVALLVVVRGLVWPVGQGQPQLITIAPGQSASGTASLLVERELIRSPTLFLAAAYASGKWRRLQAGRYDLAPDMSALEILDALCRGARKAWRWVTIPEGYTLRQVAHELEKERLVTAADFLMEARLPSGLDPGFPLPGSGLEGYLFPDTYRVDVGEKANDIIAQLLRRFNHVVWQGMFDGKPSYRGRSLNEIIILASLVEGEAKKDDERAIIAGVLMNRLRRGNKLECDATVQYALGQDRKSRLGHQDLLIESRYNTYQYAGLPPGPICNPGEASIRAAMDPAQVPYLYYVARPDGSHTFSETFAQHQAAIARVRNGAAR